MKSASSLLVPYPRSAGAATATSALIRATPDAPVRRVRRFVIYAAFGVADGAGDSSAAFVFAGFAAGWNSIV